MKYYNGEEWLFPYPPVRNWDYGRVSDDGISMYPRLFQDKYGRIYLFFRHSAFIVKKGSLPWIGKIHYRRYSGGSWGRQEMVPHTGVKASGTWWISVAYDGDRTFRGSCEILSYRPPIITVEDVELVVNRTLKKTPKGIRGAEGHPDHEKRPLFDPRPGITVEGLKYYLYYGDTHTHSIVSDGVDPLDLNYHYARDIALLDFYSATDHDFLHGFGEAACGHDDGIELHLLDIA